MSEENNQNTENQTNSQTQASQAKEGWEAQLQAHASEVLARRIGPLKAEVERLQSTISEISARLIEQTQTAPTEAETSGLLDYVRQWFSDSKTKAEEEFESRLANARQEATAAAREEAEREFPSRIEQVKLEWESASLQAGEEAFQKRLELACAEAAAVSRRESEAQIEDLREQLEASRKALTLAVSSAPTATAQSAGFELLRTAVDEIDMQRTQSETLTALVRRAAQFAPRVVFFVVKGADAVGWKASGFENGLNDETVRLLTVPTQNRTLLRDALTGFQTSVGKSSSPGENSAVLGLYGSPAPERAIAVPLVVRGKAAAVLYADSGVQSESSINTAAIEALMRVASMGIELLPARRGVEPIRPPSPSSQLSAPAAPAPPVTEPPKPVEKPAEPGLEAAHAVEPEPSQTEEKQRITVDLPPSSPKAASLHEARPAETGLEEAEAQSHQPAYIEAELEEPQKGDTADLEPPPGYDLHPEAIEAETIEEHFEPVSAETEPEFPNPVQARNEWVASAPTVPITQGRRTLDLPPEPEMAQTVEERPPATVFGEPAQPPRQAQPLISVPTPASETEQRAHNDARRFARLLVSEIKLYNAAKVNEGRRNFDLYARLKDEIDRSRKVYDKRVSPAVAARFDYFYDELVQTLAEGDPSKLGPECPGPVVLAS